MLKHDIHERTWFFDLEWVPDAVAAKRIFGLPEETTELEAIERLWRETKGFDAENCPRPFVKYLFSRVVSIAFLSRNAVFQDGEKRIDFALHSLPKLPLDPADLNEAYIIDRFLHWVGERDPQLVGFNSTESDIQVLIQRGIINEVSAPSFCRRPGKPWEGRDYFDGKFGEWHLDLLQGFSRFAMTPRLNDLALLCGFPGKIDIAGDQVVDLWLEGDLKRIIEYNQTDTLNTYLLWLRIVYFAGKITEEDYIDEQGQFREFLEETASRPDQPHIEKFLEMWEF